MPHPLFGGTANLRALADLARAHRLPAITDVSEFTRQGGLLSYGRNDREAFRRLPRYAAKLLTGTPPGLLPVEQPTEYELHLNARTATALGLTIPAALLIQAQTVIR